MPQLENVFMNLLRILTPDEISKLIETSEKKERATLTDMINNEVIKKTKKQVVESEMETKGKDKEELLTPELKAAREKKQKEEELIQKELRYKEEQRKKIEIARKAALEKSKERHIPFMGQKEEMIEEERINISSFILDEQQKSKKFREKMQKIEISRDYAKNAKIVFKKGQANQEEDDAQKKKTDHFGILVNKKIKDQD